MKVLNSYDDWMIRYQCNKKHRPGGLSSAKTVLFFVHLQGFEPWTNRLRVYCSTNWAKGAYVFNASAIITDIKLKCKYFWKKVVIYDTIVTVHTRHSQKSSLASDTSWTLFKKVPATTFAHKKALPSSLCIQLIPHASMIITWIHVMSEL